ncbi:MAG: ABC transporter substrate-binding protein, partial [Oscillospiraceae bacterium]|nr:ABC transporter substrate-binding protein [Oscillospiraceae bacterium]
DNAYSAGIFDKFKSEAGTKNLEIVSEQSFTSDNATDFSAQIQSIKDSGAELMFLPIYYSEASLILQQAKNAGLDVKVFGCDGLDGILNMNNFDVSLAEGVMLLTPFAADATDDATVHFVTEYRAKFGDETMNQFAADAYDAIYIIKAAAEKAGVTADMSASDICNALKTAMTQVTVDGVTGTSITWAADGEPSKAPKAVVINDGSYKAM